MNGGTLIAIMVITFLVCELLAQRRRPTKLVQQSWPVATTNTSTEVWWPAATTATTMFYIDHLYIEGGKPLPYIDWTNPETLGEG